MLRSIDPHFTDWIAPLSGAEELGRKSENQLDVYVVAPILAALVLSCLGTMWQLHRLRYSTYASTSTIAYGGKSHMEP